MGTTLSGTCDNQAMMKSVLGCPPHCSATNRPADPGNGLTGSPQTPSAAYSDVGSVRFMILMNQ